VKLRPILGTAMTIALSACSGGSQAPAGWQLVPGTSASWTTGAGASRQRYDYAKRSYDGSLHDLASQQAIDIVLRHPGAIFRHSDPFAACPGLAAVETFAVGKRSVLQIAFATQPNGQAVIVTYDRPAGTPVDPSVAGAMKRALCVTPL
jgi:hypothetical protein